MTTRLGRGQLRQRILDCLMASEELVPTARLLRHAYGDTPPLNARNSIANAILMLRALGCDIEGVGCGSGFKGYRLHRKAREEVLRRRQIFLALTTVCPPSIAHAE